MSCPFPPELFPVIFDLVEADKDLFSLASSSSAFNYFALKSYFSRHRLDPTSRKIQIPASPSWTFQQVNLYIQALLLSLNSKGRDITFLGYQYNNKDGWVVVVQQAKMVKRLIEYFGKIHELKVTLFTPSIGYKGGLAQATSDLLDAIRRKNCSQLQLHGSSVIFTQPLIGSRGTKHLEFKNVGESVVPLLWIQKKLTFGDSKRNKDLNPESSLTHFKMDTFPFSFRRFSLDLLQISSLKLTHLHFLNIRDCSEIDFTTFLKGVNLPNLIFLIIRACNRIYQEALFDFVARHTSITHLCYTLDPWAGYTSPVPVAKLKTPPVLQKLEHIYVILSSTVNNPKDGENIMIEALKALQGCVVPLELVVSSSRNVEDFALWFKSVDLSQPRPECSLTCVRSLNLSYLHREFVQEEVEYLSTCMGLFPSLEEICLEIYKDKVSGKGVPPYWNKPRSREVAEKLKDVCPSIRKFSIIKGCTRALAWTFDEGSKIPVFVTA
ncbi:hypothetical protein BJ165DRAFT_1526917 [Panaeolus papilionaceus]|nr:hypothetical protein BJ165DRAFT_1526917 [Panaeolus papilionaceus]